MVLNKAKPAQVAAYDIPLSAALNICILPSIKAKQQKDGT